jgi:tol-pal system protein YbgF
MLGIRFAASIVQPTMTSQVPCALVLALVALCLAGSRPAAAQQDTMLPSANAPATDRAPSLKDEVSGLFDGLFGRPDSSERAAGNGRKGPSEQTPDQVEMAQMSAPDLIVRLDQLEHQIRQLTGAIEQLQFRNQQLEQTVRRMQEDTEFRFRDLGSRGGAGPAPPGRPMATQPNAAMNAPVAAGSPPPPPPPTGRRADVFDPTQNPTAPGAPRQLGSISGPSVPPPAGTAGAGIIADESPPIGASGGRSPGAPLDLSTLPPGANPPSETTGMLPPPPPRNPSATGGQLAAVAPPTPAPKDEYDLAYGYVLRKDYALAEETFRGFLRKYPSDRLAPDAHYWLGESLFQRQRFRDSAEAFLMVTTKYETAAKAPEALLRLGQSLAALGEKEAACAALGEVVRKYPRSSLGVKQGVEREQKRVRC